MAGIVSRLDKLNGATKCGNWQSLGNNYAEVTEPSIDKLAAVKSPVKRILMYYNG